MIKVGDLLYRFDENRRKYAEPVAGRAYGQIIWAEHFHPGEVVTETRVSKTTLSSAGAWATRWYTEQGRIDAIWAHEHHRRIMDALQHCPVEILREVALIIDRKH
jgi:hypothetical protein